MKPLRGVAWRARTFLSQPVHEVSSSLETRLDRAETAATARFDHVVAMLTEQARSREIDIDEGRRLHVALRTVVEDQGAEIARLRAEIEALRASAGTPADRS